jgi:hypothetical protein
MQNSKAEECSDNDKHICAPATDWDTGLDPSIHIDGEGVCNAAHWYLLLIARRKEFYLEEMSKSRGLSCTSWRSDDCPLKVRVKRTWQNYHGFNITCTHSLPITAA